MMEKANTTSLFPPLVAAVAEALEQIFLRGRYADKVIEQVLRQDPRRGARDRAFIAAHTYDIVRWYRLLTAAMGYEPQDRAGFYALFGAHWLLSGAGLPAWREFATLDAQQLRATREALLREPAIAESIPDWLEALGRKQLGDLWPATIHALNQPAQLVVRVNRLKADKEAVRVLLEKEGSRLRDLPGDALLLTERRNLFQSEAFRRGWIEVQDYSSQQVAPFVQAQPGMRVIDACAGAGGKSLHLAACMHNKGQLIALDTEAWKLSNLRQRARRAGAHIIDSRPIENTKILKRLHESADRLLLDVPCSGLGVLRRNPDAKWKLSPDFIARVQQTQQDLLVRYSSLCKPGGMMVYATCSILPSENQQQVVKFLEQEAGRKFELQEDRVILPQDEGFDGFYMARLSRHE
jgi:16S rRNA (cytosine967-C5)-methyltransferase